MHYEVRDIENRTLKGLQQRTLDHVCDGVVWCIHQVAEIPCEVLAPGMRLQSDIGLDSLDLVELAMNIEKQFGIELPDEKGWEYRNSTIAEVAELVKQELERKAK